MREDILTLEEATLLCHEYSDLIGQPFCGEYRSLGSIESIVVCPHGKLDKYYFLKQYHVLKDVDSALLDYKGSEYDVVLIGHDALQQPTCRDLRAHLAYASLHPDMAVVLD